MISLFDVGISIHLLDKVSGSMSAIIRSLNMGEAAASALQTRMNAVHSVFNSGLMMGAGAFALAAPLMKAEDAAEHLEKAMTRLQLNTRANAEEMQGFNKLFTEVSNQTGIFSKPKLADFAYNMRESGLDKDQIRKLLPLYAKGADVMQVLSEGKINAESSAHGFTALSHQFGKYDEASMRPIVEAATRISMQLPGGLNTLVKMGSYVNILGNRVMGIDPVKLMALEAAIAQTSGGTGTGRGQLSASNLSNALQRVMPGVFGGGLLEGKSAFAANVLGLADKAGISNVTKTDKATGKSSTDISAIMATLGAAYEGTSTAAGRVAFAQRMQANLGHLSDKQAAQMIPMIKEIISSGGEKGSQSQLLTTTFANLGGSSKTIFSLFSDPTFQAQYKKQLDLGSKGKSVEQMQEDISKTNYFQRIRAATNLETLMSTVGTALLPTFKKILTGLGDFFYNLNNFAEAHPRLIQMGVGLVALSATLLAVGAAVQITRAAFMGLGIIFTAIKTAAAGFQVVTRVGAIMAAVSAASIPLAPILAGVVIGIGAVMLVSRNWTAIITTLKANLDNVKIATALLLSVMDKLGGVIMRVARQIGGVLGAIGGNLAEMGKYAFDLTGTGGMGQAAPAPAAAPGLPKAMATDWANKVIAKHGMKDAFDALSKYNPEAVAASGNQGSPTTVVNHITAPIHVNGAQNPQQVAHHVKKALQDFHNDSIHQAKTITSGQGNATSKYRGRETS